MTPRSIISLALKLSGSLGVGQTALAEDTNDAFALLNMMIGQWAQKRWLVYHLIDVAMPMTGAQSYSIGPGGNLDTPRPDRIESAFMRMGAAPQTLTGGFQLDVSPLDITAMDGPLTLTTADPTPRSADYPLDVIEAREDWNRIGYKGMAGFPSSVFYDSGFPFGTIYVNPVPGPQFELHLSLKQTLTAFGNLSDDLNLPAQYHEAMLYNLAVRLAPMYGLPPRQDVMQIASASLNTIRISNVQVARLQMPDGLSGVGRWIGGYGASGFGSVGYATVADSAALAPTPTPPPPPVPPVPAAYTGSMLGQARLGQMFLGGGISTVLVAVATTSILGQAALGNMTLGT